MSIFSKIYDAFSKRNTYAVVPEHDIPITFRNKILFWCKEVFDVEYYAPKVSLEIFCIEIYRILVYRHGKLVLSKDATDVIHHVFTFLLNCSGDIFLDFIEDIFKTECVYYQRRDLNEMTYELNELFLYNNLPYYLTELIEQNNNGFITTQHPKIIMKENEVLHNVAIKPALEFLQRPEFKSANNEFLDALEDYKKGDYGDCLTKCNSAFESVMKIVCDKYHWPYNQSDTASKLIKTVIDKTSLESYFESPLVLIAVIRNRLSKSHGAGKESKIVPQHIARYVINATASSILLVAEEANNHKR